MKEKANNWEQYKFVIRELVTRDFKRKYRRSFLGVIWSVLNPLLTMAAMALIFTQILGRDIPNFPVFIFTGLLTVQLFNGATSSSLSTLVDNKNMLIKIKFPMEILVLSRVCTAIVDFVFAGVAYIVILAVYRIPPSIYMLFYPVIFICLILFTLGFSFALSVAYSYFGDLKHIWSVLTSMLMWLSGVFWTIDRLSGWPERIVRANPMFNFINASRQVIMWQQLPSFNQILQMVVWGLGAFIIGMRIFKKNKVKILTKI